ncbi:protein rep [Planococcus sp. CP5-4_YE]|uniref:protein rep n=1 Tax=Planococcus sp. CP5-4_YE TaxID=2850320 RepID=UPI001C22828F|nr:protein rep [Planococcus sp. CP5-4_YE]MBU9675201.1 protein rep [Planococcus sp. CP5-4_YE]
MIENQPNQWGEPQLENTKLGADLLGKYTPKKDLNRKATAYIEKHVTVKSVVRFETCSDYLSFLTNGELSVKRLHKTNSCENRFCPICTWKTAKKDAIKLSVMLDAVKEIEGKEFLFLTLTSPNCSGEDLREELDRFNKAVKRLFERRNVKRVVKGYVRKIEVTTDQEQFITAKAFKRKKDYFEMRGLKVGDPNPTFNTYNPHVHAIVVVNKSYFNKANEFISKEEWLKMWQQCMGDKSITQIDAKKIRATGNSNAVLEIAKYAAKGSDLYHSETVFDTFYTALKGRQLLVFSGMMKDYAKKYEAGDLDRFKEKDENVYTHLLRSLWKGSKYENKLRELSPEEFEEFNKQAKSIEENDLID